MKGFMVAAFLFFALGLKAQEILKLSLNHHLIKEVRLQSGVASDVRLDIKKYKLLKSFTIALSSDNASSVFKKRLEITDVADSSLIFSYPDGIKKESFAFDIKKIATLFRYHKELKVYELMEPSNSMMRIRSKRALLLNLHIY